MNIKKLNEEIERTLNEISDELKRKVLNAREKQANDAINKLNRTKELIKRHDNIDYLKDVPQEIIDIVDKFPTQDYLDNDDYYPIEVVECVEEYLDAENVGDLYFGPTLGLDNYGIGIYRELEKEPIAEMLFVNDHFEITGIAASNKKLSLPNISKKPEFCKFIMKAGEAALDLLQYAVNKNLF